MPVVIVTVVREIFELPINLDT